MHKAPQQKAIVLDAPIQDDVCPDGNEYDLGFFISKSSWRIDFDGLARPTALFTITSPKKPVSKIDNIIFIPINLYGLFTINGMAIANHISPLFPIVEITTIILLKVLFLNLET